METSKVTKVSKAISAVVLDATTYAHDSLNAWSFHHMELARTLGDGTDSHETISLLSLMRRHHSTDGVLFGEKVSQKKVAESFGSRLDIDGKNVPNVSTSRLSKAKKLVTEGWIAETLNGADDVVGALIDIVSDRLASGQGVSIETLYNEQFSAEPKGQTLPQAVANLLAWASKNGIESSAVLAELVAQIEGGTEG